MEDAALIDVPAGVTMLEGEKPKLRRAGRPKIPADQRKVTVNTTITYQDNREIEDHGWKLNELILDGMRHKKSCGVAMREMVEEIASLTAGNAKLQDKVRELSLRLEGRNSTTAGEKPIE